MTIHTHENDLAVDPATGRKVGLLIDERHGAVRGYCLGVSYYALETYGVPGVHDFQEGFYVLEGTGLARIGDQEFRVSPGSAFIADVGVPHTMKRDPDSKPIKVLWSHGAA